MCAGNGRDGRMERGRERRRWSGRRALTSDEFGVGVLVDLGHVDDHARLLSVAQRTQALLHVAAGRTDRGDHGRLRVASQALLKQPATTQLTIICLTETHSESIHYPVSSLHTEAQCRLSPNISNNQILNSTKPRS